LEERPTLAANAAKPRTGTEELGAATVAVTVVGGVIVTATDAAVTGFINGAPSDGREFSDGGAAATTGGGVGV